MCAYFGLYSSAITCIVLFESMLFSWFSVFAMPLLKRWIVSVVSMRWIVGLVVAAIAFGALCNTAAADSAPWVAVAQSEEGIQYVDPRSIQATAQGVRLKSYWQPAPSKEMFAPVYYVTEYDCQDSYRDVETTNQPSSKDWEPIGADTLNRGAMEYGCAIRGGQ